MLCPHRVLCVLARGCAKTVVQLLFIRNGVGASGVNIVQQDHIRTRTGLCASHVLKTHFLRTGVTTSVHVHAMLGGRELLMTAEAAWLANINPILGLLRALNVKKAFTVQRKRRYATCVRQTHFLL